MRRRVPIGTSDFQELIQKDFYFIDKSLFIEEVWNHDSKVLLLPRPRRFGKTVNLSMLRYFFEQTEENTASLFQNLAIQQRQEIMEQQGQHPVIFLTFKGGKQESFDECFHYMREVIAAEYERHESVLSSLGLDSVKTEQIQRIQNRTSEKSDLKQSLFHLTKYLHQATGKKAIVLLDEYDAMIHGGVEFGYYKEIVSLTRSFMEAVFKDNIYLEKGVLTGILRVSRESIFSGLNNLTVATLLDEQFSTQFGLTELELKQFLEYFELSDQLETLREAYNGYLFGNTLIYNPWSVLNYVSNPKKGTYPYWLNTSGNQLIFDLVMKGPIALQQGLQTMLSGDSITIQVEENLTLRELEHTTADMLWSFFLFTGYLTPRKIARTFETGTETFADVCIPNNEIRLFFNNTFKKWLKLSPLNEREGDDLLKALLVGDIQTLGQVLQELVTQAFSYHDTKSDQTESFYHAFLLGLVIRLKERYRIRSNREAGFGRYDLLLMPKNSEEPGVIIELKPATSSESSHVESLLTKATDQIKSNEYATELKQQGVRQILGLAVVAKGKKVYLRGSLLGDQTAFGWDSPVQTYPIPAKKFEKQITLCYSSKDTQWLEEVQEHLKILEFKGVSLNLWDEKRMQSEPQWRVKIKETLSKTKVAVLLISQSFLTSDFILNHELPPLLQAAKKEGATIFPIVLKPCQLDKVDSLSAFQPVNDRKHPLSKLSEDDRTELLIELTDNIETLIVDNI